MFTTKFEKIFEMTDDGNPRTALIDDKLGNSKKSIRNILKTCDEKYNTTILYMSLCGLESTDDIARRLSEYLDSDYITNIGGHYFINSSYSLDETGNNSLIFFDDLESKSSSLSYRSVYGVVDHLKRLGFSVICACNSNEIKSDEEKDDYNSFLERTFDDILFVKGDK